MNFMIIVYFQLFNHCGKFAGFLHPVPQNRLKIHSKRRTFATCAMSAVAAELEET